MKTEEYEAMKRWWSKGAYGHPYSPKTQKTYKSYMDLFCRILNKTPDELANLSSEQALEAQIDLVTELEMRTLSTTQRVNALHNFWRANGVVVTDDIMKYKGSRKLLAKLSKLSETTIQALMRRTNNSAKAFVDDCVEMQIGGTLTKAEVYAEYMRYCQSWKLPILTKQKLGWELRERFASAVKDVSGRTTRCWANIKLYVVRPRA